MITIIICLSLEIEVLPLPTKPKSLPKNEVKEDAKGMLM